MFSNIGYYVRNNLRYVSKYIVLKYKNRNKTWKQLYTSLWEKKRFNNLLKNSENFRKFELITWKFIQMHRIKASNSLINMILTYQYIYIFICIWEYCTHGIISK